MHRRALLASLPLVLIASAAFAEGDTHGAAGQYVDLAPVALPIVAAGKVVNYVFVDVRIHLTPAADLAKWRDREPYFRDALVRLAHHSPFTVPTDYTKLDEARLKAELFQAAGAITGPGQVASIEIMPGGGPMRRTGLPPTAAH
jgi:hypothetical protein